MHEPKVFISYSWSSKQHQEMVKYWADRLIADGVDVIIDIYDLNEGDNKYSFMESMVTDKDVTHVLIVCDTRYTDKANARAAGVGTESMIISSEVYKKVKQSKFIPILCEFNEDDGEPIAPVFMDSRIGINFSSPEHVNENWEQLVRLLYGKPLHVKPKKGSVPSFIIDDKPLPNNESVAKFESLKQAILQDKKNLNLSRQDFLKCCLGYADELRVRERPDVSNFGNRVLDDCGKLKQVRNQLTDWVLLEGQTATQDIMSEQIIEVLEQLNELKSRPNEITNWNDSWFEAHSVFVYETFLYIIASLLKTNNFNVLQEIFSSSYLKPQSQRNGLADFDSFGVFYGYSRTLQDVLRPGDNLFSPAAELIKMQADRDDMTFSEIIQAELLVFMMSILHNCHWYPATLHYAEFNHVFPFFLRATQHKHFDKLAQITGIETSKELKEKVSAGIESSNINNSRGFYHGDFVTMMNLEKLDTIK
ncbi:hypothetical protein BCT40_10420 [Vibrio lentus]|uniref:SEFIR domain-containing protein n=1 Tax=Vibrio TaxID=662 RepID=UPI000C83AFA0|nr:MULTISPECIES: SEFIR domain-containing protein [Vibrio]PMG54154.1 hypothetical protein BCU87_24805 [Vibrio lentus]PMI20515.1 hypothetical protein BCU50_17680 [Vibrio sp. 10N.286.46.E10]PMM97695.1 hypothetical protein BCT40_10420 [Vibrio lentus]